MKHSQLLNILVIILLVTHTLTGFAQPAGTTKISAQSWCTVANDFWVNTTTDDNGGATIAWAGNTNALGITVQNWTDGRANTLAAAMPVGYYAAAVCKSKAVGAEGGSWYLPSYAELMMIYSAYRAGALSGFQTASVGSSYWSSTEHSFATTVARTVSFIDGTPDNITKTASLCYLRCVWRQ